MLSVCGRKCATLNESFKNIIFNYERERNHFRSGLDKRR